MADQVDPNEISAERAEVQRLFVRHSVDVRGYLYGLCGDLHDVDDLLHETFLVANRKAADYHPGTDFVAWVREIARLEVLRTARVLSRLPRAFSPEVLELLGDSLEVTKADDERIAALAACLDELTPRSRQAIEYRYQQGKKAPEIATLVSLTLDSVYVTLSRARAALRLCMQRRLRQKKGAS
jgi:RNA polymerase sigma-70 factor (ECF subfamily)